MLIIVAPIYVTSVPKTIYKDAEKCVCVFFIHSFHNISNVLVDLCLFVFYFEIPFMCDFVMPKTAIFIRFFFESHSRFLEKCEPNGRKIENKKQ